MHEELRYREIGDKDVIPDPLVAEDPGNVNRIGAEHIHREGTHLVQRIFPVILFFAKQADIGSGWEAAREDVFLELMEQQRHEHQDHKTPQIGKVLSP